VIALPERDRRERETPVLRRCLIALNRLPGVRAVRNNNGKLQDLSGRWVAFGLGDGSADLQCRIQITARGGVLPCVFWIEVKAEGARTSKKRAALQRMFREEAATRGELTAQVTNEADAVRAADRFRAEYKRRLDGYPLAPCDLPSGPRAHDGDAP